MAWPKGKPRPEGAGRQKGSANKATAKIKEAVVLLVENNLDNMSTWLTDVAKEDPKEALRIVTGLLEYSIPKLARVEAVGEDGGPIRHCIKIEHV
jgi:hypothetical protein